jgi:phosphoribosylformylglycinamidine synthase subunit PurQ / glutaminase
MPKIAVLAFPGNNCEIETKRAIEKSGIASEIIRWNEKAEILESFDGVVVPGGFSFEDRGRSGVIAAQEPILETVKKMAEEGKPILGICNGAQILVESGLLLSDQFGRPAVALARNERKQNGKILGTGFYHSWVHIQKTGLQTPFSQGEKKLIHLPVAHGEGRFLFADELQVEHLEELVCFEYTDQEGKIHPEFPSNPNGSYKNAAAIRSPRGNVVAIMPHPERSPDGAVLFDSLAEFLKNPCALPEKNIPAFAFAHRQAEQRKQYSLEFFVRLRITDNTRITLENTAQRKWKEIALSRMTFWGIQMEENSSEAMRKEMAEKILRSNELLNIEKEFPIIRIGESVWTYEKEKGLLPTHDNLLPKQNAFLSREKKDFVGLAKLEHLNSVFEKNAFQEISFGTVWGYDNAPKDEVENDSLFANFVSESIASAL